MTDPVDFPAGDRVAFAAGGPGAIALLRPSNGEEVGRLCYALPEPGILVIEALEVAPEFRGYGVGSEAAGLIVEGARSHGCTRVRALAPGRIGLSVYFWTRMGFRPLHGKAPAEGIWFERTLD